MNMREAKAIVADPKRKFTEKYQAVAFIIAAPNVAPSDLLDCLSVGGISAEMAAMKLHSLTARPLDNKPTGAYLKKEDWQLYLDSI